MLGRRRLLDGRLRCMTHFLIWHYGSHAVSVYFPGYTKTGYRHIASEHLNLSFIILQSCGKAGQAGHCLYHRFTKTPFYLSWKVINKHAAILRAFCLHQRPMVVESSGPDSASADAARPSRTFKLTEWPPRSLGSLYLRGLNAHKADIAVQIRVRWDRKWTEGRD